MRLRRRHRSDWPLPSGLAEVELFRFWEADLADQLPADLVALPPTTGSATPVQASGDPWTTSDGLSTAPLWGSAALIVLVLLAVLIAVLV